MGRWSISAWIGLQVLFICGLALADEASASSRPSDESSSATTQPDIQQLQEQVTICHAALLRAQAVCIRRLADNDDYKDALADVDAAQKELNSASDPESRAQAASNRIAARKHLDEVKARALATDRSLAAAATAEQAASNAYQNAMIEASVAATAAHANNGDRPPESDADEAAVKEMLDRGEAQSLADTKSILAEIRDLDDKLSNVPEDDDHNSQREDIIKSISKDRRLLVRFQNAKGHFLPSVLAEVGSTGTIYGTMHILQIVDPTDAIITGDDKQAFWVKGVDVSKFVDGEEIEFYRALRVTGTKQYNAVAGGTNTVFVLEPFGPENP